MGRVRLAASARAFLLSEAAYLEARNPDAAERFLARLREAQRHLARFAELGFEPDAPPVPGVRRLIVGQYVIDYEIADGVVILAIRHGRQHDPSIPLDDDFDYEV